MSESDEKHDEKAGQREKEASGDPEKRRINDPLTSKDAESPRTSWQPQRPSPQANSQEDDEAGDSVESSN